MPPLPRALVVAVLVGAAAAQHDGVAPTAKPPATVDFSRQVRPILAQHCYSCHGPDDAKRKGDLRLDRRLDAFGPRENGPAFVGGDLEHSEAFARIISTDDEERMPPPKAADTLKPAEIEVLRQWIASGAQWNEHWAFVAPVRPTPVNDGDMTWAKNDIDRFVLARLRTASLPPSAEAPREAWLRRVTFDLIGLPPTLAEIDAVVKDTAAHAFDKVADRLLADARYGERQASEWLDAARYADSSGYQRDTARQAWKWRDWVIEAFNLNMPFDQFTIEQLAGDLLPNPTLAQRIATGFNRNHPVNTEAGEELDEYRSAYVIDRVHTTATTFLGLSVGCAQCHDHKYDPISQREFYGFYDFFNHVKEKDNGSGRNPKPTIPAPGPDDIPRIADLEHRIKTLKQRLDRDDPLADAAQLEWQQATLARLGAELPWTTLTPTELMAKHGSRLSRLEDGSILASGPVPARDTYELVFAPGKRTMHALRLEVLPDPSMPHGASGRADDGRFILSGLEVRLASVADSSDPPRLVFATAQADVTQERDEEEHYLTAIDPGEIGTSLVSGGDSKEGGGFRFGGGGWSVAGDERKEPREAVLIPIEPITANETSVLRITMTHGSSNKFKSLIGRFRISSTDHPRVRTLLLPLQPSLWRSLGPFTAASVDAAYTTAFAVEQDLASAAWKKKYEPPVVEPKSSEKPTEKPADKKAEQPVAAAAEPKKAESATEPTKKTEVKNALLELFGMSSKPAAKTKAGETAATEPVAADKNDKDDNKDEDGAEKPEKPKPKKLEWQEQRDWRDGESARLAVQGAASAVYVSRKVKCETARTMVLELDGGVGAKVWVNGTLVGEFAPAPEAPEPATKPPVKEEEFDEEAFFAKRFGRSEREPRRLRLGLRAGDNYFVVKLVGKGATAKPDRGGAPMGMPMAMAMEAGAEAVADFPMFAMPPRGDAAGLSFTCKMKPEGDDLLDYEVMKALRTPKVAAPASPAAPVAGPVIAIAAEAVAKPPTPTPTPTTDPDDIKPKTPAERRTRAVRRWFRTRIDIAGRVLFEELERVKAEKDRVESKLPSALVMEELKTPRQTHVFVRGDYRKKGDVVTAMVPAVLPPMPADLPKNRLGLARWLVSKDHPLTARVTVNRYWQQFFGLGLVRTADDFGIRGTQPSHPELLDWLASEFVQSGWNVKKLHRLLVLSATYRQTNVAPPEAWTRDPDNELLARGPRQRLAAEMVRDQALAVGDLLVQKVGGPSVKPFQPTGLWKSMLGSGDWKVDTGDDARRRGLYVYWKRGVPYPSFTIFDAAKRETCTVTRTRTTTPLQALVTMNDPVQVEAGRALGLRMHKDGGKDDEARLVFGFRLATSRRPDDKELSILKALLADQRKHFEGNLDAAKLVLGIADAKATRGKRSEAPMKAAAKDAAKPTAKPGTTPEDKPKEPAKKKGEPDVPPAEAAAWAQIGCTLLNLEAAIRRG